MAEGLGNFNFTGQIFDDVLKASIYLFQSNIGLIGHGTIVETDYNELTNETRLGVN
jgi:hypothetical protein